jgi:hypothetical protein
MTFSEIQRSRNSCGAFLGCRMPPHAVDCQKLTQNIAKSAAIRVSWALSWRSILTITIGLHAVILSAHRCVTFSWR